MAVSPSSPVDPTWQISHAVKASICLLELFWAIILLARRGGFAAPPDVQCFYRRILQLSAFVSMLCLVLFIWMILEYIPWQVFGLLGLLIPAMQGTQGFYLLNLLGADTAIEDNFRIVQPKTSECIFASHGVIILVAYAASIALVLALNDPTWAFIAILVHGITLFTGGVMATLILERTLRALQYRRLKVMEMKEDINRNADSVVELRRTSNRIRHRLVFTFPICTFIAAFLFVTSFVILYESDPSYTEFVEQTFNEGYTVQYDLALYSYVVVSLAFLLLISFG
mmetsp:Transcript_573/g.1385  ORF Transcript_573/g.1385 Transcript_573/m.1385 type:complete len:284 (+) Transcript_573:163-1014(+)